MHVYWKILALWASSLIWKSCWRSVAVIFVITGKTKNTNRCIRVVHGDVVNRVNNRLDIAHPGSPNDTEWFRDGSFISSKNLLLATRKQQQKISPLGYQVNILICLWVLLVFSRKGQLSFFFLVQSQLQLGQLSKVQYHTASSCLPHMGTVLDLYCSFIIFVRTRSKWSEIGG